VAAAIAGYFSSADFTGLADNTKRGRRNILERFREQYGDKGIATLQRHRIEQMIDAKPSPETRLHFLLTLRYLMRFAVRTGLRADDPTQGIKRPKIKSDGFYAWTEDDIAKFEAAHPIGTRARLAMALGLYTGQRRGDVIRMGRQHIRDGVIEVRQEKTSEPLLIPIHPNLAAILETVPRNQLTFVVTQYASPFSALAYTNWFTEQCRKAGLPAGASFHGLRKAAARRLAEAGCSAPVIAAITGHKSLKEVARYIKSADQLRLARMGIEAISRTK
jgi:integrase